MRRNPPPDVNKLKMIYHYEPDTGHFRFKVNRRKGRKGNIAGTHRPDGYIGIAFEGISYLAHDLAWFIFYGEWPLQIDHINRQRNQNWIKNLRLATRAQNNGNSDGWGQEKRKHKLPRGVYLYHRTGWYRSQIVVNRKQIHLGCFNSIEGAETAYKKAARKYFGEFSPFK